MKKLLFAVMMACSATACGEKDGAPPAAPSVSGERMVKGPGDAKVGDTTRCPVTGEEFVVDPGSPKLDYEGSTYYFASEVNKKRFEANPDKYVPKATKPSSSVAPVVATPSARG